MVNFKKLALVLLSCGCHRRIVVAVCPLPLEYSSEFQKNLLEDLEKVSSFYIEQLVIDFYNINQQLRLVGRE
ncbi:MAG: hypothetical protein LBB13_00435 [Rickettsiales bacterium]|jgi:hypothetical protein|nr:hypothetical protein [Rickettsiales bacterium]